MSIAELLAKNEDSKTTKNLIKNGIQQKNATDTVSDLKPIYDKIMW